MKEYYLETPLKEEDMRALRAGDVVYITGTIFTARDMAHLKIRSLIDNKEPLPNDLNGAAIFHAGPVALKDENGNWNLNVIGPTTSIRMEPHAKMVGELGAKAIIGKGGMAGDTLKACADYGYVYLQAAPGCAAKLAEGIDCINNVSWLEMGIPEAMWELKANKFGPLVVAMDSAGNSIYENLRIEAFKKIDALYPTA